MSDQFEHEVREILENGRPLEDFIYETMSRDDLTRLLIAVHQGMVNRWRKLAKVAEFLEQSSREYSGEWYGGADEVMRDAAARLRALSQEEAK